MSLENLINKYGKPKMGKWFTEKSMRIPAELQPYLDIEDGKLIEIAPVPEELKELEVELRSIWVKIHSLEDITEYRVRDRACEGCMYDTGDPKYCLIYLEESGKEKPEKCKHRKTFKEMVKDE